MSTSGISHWKGYYLWTLLFSFWDGYFHWLPLCLFRTVSCLCLSMSWEKRSLVNIAPECLEKNAHAFLHHIRWLFGISVILFLFLGHWTYFSFMIFASSTFFRQFHSDLAYTVRCLLKDSEGSQAFFFSPRRGNTLDMFLDQVRKLGLKVDVVEKYDSKVFGLHQEFINGENSSWPNYVADHCYPLMIKITF